MKIERKGVYRTMYLPKELYEKLVELAKSQDRKFNDTLTKVLAEALATK